MDAAPRATDSYGNEHAPGLPYARGEILTSTEDDFRKLQEAWRHVAGHVDRGGPDAVFNFSGLEHGLPLAVIAAAPRKAASTRTEALEMTWRMTKPIFHS